jgi:hypothetical protein
VPTRSVKGRFYCQAALLQVNGHLQGAAAAALQHNKGHCKWHCLGNLCLKLTYSKYNSHCAGIWHVTVCRREVMLLQGGVSSQREALRC